VRVTILGSGGSAGVPMIGGADGHGDWGACDPNEPRNRRSRSSIVIESETGERLLVDTAPEMRGQLIAAGIGKADAILFTHAHADHITGLDDVRILNRTAGRPLDAYASRATFEELERRFDYAFRPWTPPGFFRPVLVTHAVAPGDTLRVAGLEIQIFGQDHFVTETLGLRAGGFAYSTDAVALDEAAMTTLADVDTWVVGCFQRQPHKTHAHLAQVLAWAAALRVRRTVLTHMGTDLDWSWMCQTLPAGVEPAHDGMILEVAG
jgi:phosphoribosyl 1,2-cyclic phosphate phosphodiesterase